MEADSPNSSPARQVDTKQDADIKVLACVQCGGPVPSNATNCYNCGAPLTGKEFAYIPHQAAGPDIRGMIKWWAILSIGVFALGGFSFGIGSSIAFTVLTLVYLIRILRAYYS